jgi:hypothetical protein
MKQIGTVLAKSGSRGSLPDSAKASDSRSYLIGDVLPRIYIQSTDVDLPRSAWSAWRPDVGARCLRRALTPAERKSLTTRMNELAPVVAPFGRAEAPHVALALTDMYGGYTSMRQAGDEAEARVESLLRSLAPYPAWAIQKACRDIQINGVWRDGKFDTRWPPNDAEITAAVRKEADLYANVHRSAVALLSADVEEE